MKQYPSILTFKEAGIPKNPQCLAFVKYDGSNIRFEYSKRKWEKFGTRTQLLDPKHPVLGKSIDLFREQWEKSLTDTLMKHNIEKAVVFFEYYGPNSFAGQHDLNDTMTLTMIDINVHRKGLMPARDFIKIFGHLSIAEVIYDGNFNKQFVEDVQEGKYNVVEGIVAKGGNSAKDFWMRKVKTKTYLEKLKKFNIPE